MTKGFYNLTSGILSQSRRLDTVANNMTNLSTSGYKAEQYTDMTNNRRRCIFNFRQFIQNSVHKKPPVSNNISL